MSVAFFFQVRLSRAFSAQIRTGAHNIDVSSGAEQKSDENKTDEKLIGNVPIGKFEVLFNIRLRAVVTMETSRARIYGRAQICIRPVFAN